MAPEPAGVQRFTNRVEDYALYRPGYPPEVTTLAKQFFDLPLGATVADVGSGTGKLSVEFLQAGFSVFGVEPNAAMRRAASHDLSTWEQFHNLAGIAEALPLRDDSVHLVVAGQAFQWFDQVRVRRECMSVLHPGGGVMLIWNNRRTASNAFLQEYEAMLLHHCPDYHNVGNKHYEAVEIAAFFGGRHESACLRYQQHMNLTALEGRIFSSSYTPASGPARQGLEQATRRLFAAHAVADRVCVDYDTEVFYGRLA
jgi:SAM-dependent methyltransferase